MHTPLVISLLCILINVPVSTPASYENCRLIPGHSLIYHRRIKQGPTKHISVQVVSFPEVLIDLHAPGDKKVISCILCKDLRANAELPTDSECRIVTGGVGHTFVKFALTCGPHRGYDYDIKIYGQRRFLK